MNPLRQKMSPYYRETEYWLIEGPRERLKIEQRREQILHSSPPTISDGMPWGNEHGDPTATKAIVLEKLNYKLQWCITIEQIEQDLANMNEMKSLKLIKLKRIYGRECKRIANEMLYSETNICAMWKELIFYTIMKAAKNSKLNIFFD